MYSAAVRVGIFLKGSTTFFLNMYPPTARVRTPRRAIAPHPMAIQPSGPMPFLGGMGAGAPGGGGGEATVMLGLLFANARSEAGLWKERYHRPPTQAKRSGPALRQPLATPQPEESGQAHQAGQQGLAKAAEGRDLHRRLPQVVVEDGHRRGGRGAQRGGLRIGEGHAE